MARASDEQVESVNQSVTRDFSARPVNFSTFGIPSRLEHTVAAHRRRTRENHENHLTMEVHLEILKDADDTVKMRVTVRVLETSPCSPLTFPPIHAQNRRCLTR
jgi:hypothetical protein